MKLNDYMRAMSQDQRVTFSVRCGTTIGHMRNVSYGKTCGEDLAIQIEKHSAGAVTCEELRPDVEWAVLRGTTSKVAA